MQVVFCFMFHIKLENLIRQTVCLFDIITGIKYVGNIFENVLTLNAACTFSLSVSKQ